MAKDPYGALPPATRRANLEAHRGSLLSDMHAQDLHLARLKLFGSDDVPAAEARLELFAAAVADVDAQLRALEGADDAAT
jgi:hypothetical protein